MWQVNEILTRCTKNRSTMPTTSNLHVMLVTDPRCRVIDEASLTLIRDGSFRIAEKKGHQIAALSVMPDHLHVALRANTEHSPEEVALAFQNNLAFMLRKGAIWRPGYYVGTFGEYNMNAIRRTVRLESASPAGQAGRGLVSPLAEQILDQERQFAERSLSTSGTAHPSDRYLSPDERWKSHQAR